jgi:hypothetical protein
MGWMEAMSQGGDAKISLLYDTPYDLTILSGSF